MTIEISFTDELTNTRYAPLAVLSALYQQHHVLQALDEVAIPMKVRDFQASDKLIQVMLSILAGCTTLAEVNQKLKTETALARIWNWERFADQSSLSRTLDELTQTNLEQLRRSTTAISHRHSRVYRRDFLAARGLKQVKKATLPIKKRQWPPIGTCQRRCLP